MKKTGWTILLATALSYIPVVGAQEQEQASEEPFKTVDWRKDFSIAIGTKLWFNEWTTWDTPTGTTFVTSNDSDDYEFTPIPVISIKYHDLFVSASYFMDTDYDFPTIALTDRREWDVAVGYYLLPPYLALTVGFKDIKQEIDASNLEFKFNGPTVGFVGAVPMKWGFSLYSSFAYGFLKEESDLFEIRTRGLLNVPGSGDDNRDSEYWLVEAGIAYTHNLQNLPVNLLLSSATVYAGYRHQQIETDDVGICSNVNVCLPGEGNTANGGLDITRGMVIGVNLSF
jgi:hypothetical protein